MDPIQQEEYTKKCLEHLATVEKQLDVKDGQELWKVLDELDQWLMVAIDLKTKKLKRNGEWLEPQIWDLPAECDNAADIGKEKEERPSMEDAEDELNPIASDGKEKEKADEEEEEKTSSVASDAEAVTEKEEGQQEVGHTEEELDPIRKDEWRLLIRCLLNKFIPKACKTLLRKRYLMQTRQRVNIFLQNVMHITALHILTDTKLELVKNLGWMFDPELAFYPVYHSYKMGPSGQMITYYDAPDEQPGQYATRSGRISVFVVDNVTAFGAAGGFDYIAARIALKERPIALGHLVVLLEPLIMIRKCLKWPFAASWWRKVQPMILDRILTMDDQEFKMVSKEDLGRIFTTLEKLSKLLVNPLRKEVEKESCAEELEKFKLALAHKCLLTSNLEKRLYGINTVTALINMAQRRDENKAKGPTAYSYYTRSLVKTKATKWMSTSFIVGWLEEKQIVDLLFGKGLHFELISRSKDILRVLSEFKRFGEDDINLLWSAAVGKGKQERITDTIYDLFDHLTKDLEPHLVAFLVQKIRATRVFDAKTLNLMKTLTLNQLLEDDDNDRRIGGLQLYWDIIQDDHFISHAISKEATNHLKEIVVRNRCEEYRKSFIQMCAQNIQQSRSVPQSLKLLLEIFDTFHISNYSEGRGALIEGIEQEFGFLDLFFADMMLYKQKAKEKLEKARAAISSPSLRQNEDERDTNKQILIGVEPHLKQMKIRLKFLHYILKYSSLNLPLHHLDTLWRCIIDDGLTPEEKDLGLNWLIKACGNPSVFNYKDLSEATKLIFKDKLCSKLDYSSITQSGLLCFMEYFRFFNCEQRKLEKLSSSWSVSKQPTFIVRDMNLLGLEALWTLVLNVTDENVASDAIDELNELYDAEKMSVELKRDIGRIRDGYISTIMHHLDTSSSEQKNISVIRRCLTLLTTFLEDLEKQTAKSVSAYGTAASEEIALYFYAMQNDSRFLIEVQNTITLRALKIKVAERLERRPGHVVLHLTSFFNYERDTVDENLKLCEIGLADNHVIYFDLIDYTDDSDDEEAEVEQEADVSGAPTQEAQHPPSYVLTNNQTYFKLLFSLLSLDDQVAQLAWDLLANLPTNATLEKSIVSFHTVGEEPKWVELIDPTSAFALLYSLRIVKAALQRDIENGDLSWSLQLVAQGGLRHLADILYRQDQLLRGNISKHCLLALLQIMETVITLPQVPASEVDSAIDSEKLIEGLLSAVMRSAIDTEVQANEIDGQVVKTICALIVIFVRPSSVYQGRGLFLLDRMVSDKEFSSLLYRSLLTSADSSIRIEVADLINTLYLAGREEHKRYFLVTLFNFLPRIEPTSQRCSEYFVVLSEILKHYHNEHPFAESESTESEQESSSLVQPFVASLTSLIKSHPIVEKSESAPADQVLTGLLQIFKELAERLPSSLKYKAGTGDKIIEEIFNKCLFEVPIDAFGASLAPPKCKSKIARTAAFALLTELLRDSTENQMLLLDIMRKAHLNNAQDNEIASLGFEWNHSPSAGERSSTSYVGLKNLGCTCYMNSLLQQFFMMPDFRQGILSIDLPKDYDFSSIGVKKKMEDEEADQEEDDTIPNWEDDEDESYDEEVVIKKLTEKHKADNKKKAPTVIGSDDILVELQVMFGFLQESLRQFYNPRGFCFANKDYDGQPVDTSVQMDVDEFFNMICDRLESKLKGTRQEKLLQNIWCGKMSSQLICRGCPHRSERDEQFYTISLDIQNKKDIMEALQLYVRGDMLEGDNAYFCDICKKHVDTLKRSCIKTLPNTLILHLKRFEFDFDTMRKVKLNDYCEFPELLNMLPYTREGLALQEMNETETDVTESTPYQAAAEEGAQSTTAGNGVAPKEPQPQLQPREYYEYELVGILVHRGVADSGHYYSFIKERTGEGKWIEFNDKMVAEFSAKVPLLMVACVGECVAEKED